MAVAGDRIFPAVVFQHMPEVMQLVFVIALISALFPSADGALTALTSSYCIDILGLKRSGGPGRGAARSASATACTWRSRSVFLLLVLAFQWSGRTRA